MEFLDYLALTAVTSTLGFFLTGIPICRNIKRRGSSDGISAMPFIMCIVGSVPVILKYSVFTVTPTICISALVSLALLGDRYEFYSCIFWLRYGILKQDRTVISINSIGLILELVYMVFYYVYTIYRGPINRMLLLSITICAAMLFYIDGVKPPYETAVAHLGMMCLTLNVMNFGAPLASVKEVLRKKSTENLPLPLIAANLGCAIQWFMYGYLINDIYMTVPNMIGVALSLCQLSLFVMYPAPSAALRQT